MMRRERRRTRGNTIVLYLSTTRVPFLTCICMISFLRAFLLSSAAPVGTILCTRTKRMTERIYPRLFILVNGRSQNRLLEKKYWLYAWGCDDYLQVGVGWINPPGQVMICSGVASRHWGSFVGLDMSYDELSDGGADAWSELRGPEMWWGAS